ncbi:MAG: hypothetical protein NWE92_06290 [Candidatus Bathyarchaeota archaeon]|nr:hypothetical protein [Candidatus Bathyarchaeota archaeon]
MKLSYKAAFLAGLLIICLTAGSTLAQVISSNITSVTSPTNVDLNSVAIVNNATSNPSGDLTQLNAWAVGDGGIILQWNGNSWTTVSSPTSMNLNSVVFINSTIGWAVGGNDNGGVILRYDGTWKVWELISFSGDASAKDALNAELYGVAMDGSGMVGWAVGKNGLTLGWNGQSWFSYSAITSNTLRSVSLAANSAQAWAVGDRGTIIHWNGNAWSSMASPTIMPLYAVEMINASTGWAAGGDNNRGIILQMSNSNWAVQTRINFGGPTNSTAGGPTDAINGSINSISVDTDKSAWAVGAYGTVLYWEGNEWAGQVCVGNGENLNGVSMVHGNPDSTQAWAVGNKGTIMAWTGAVWVPELPVLLIIAPVIFGVGLIIVALKKMKLRSLQFH